MYSYLCNRALAATCHATATSNKTNKVKFVWVGLSCEPISLSPITKKIQKKEGFYFYLFVVFFLHFLMSFEEAPGKQIAIFKKGTHIHIHLGLPGCVCVAFF